MTKDEDIKQKRKQRYIDNAEYRKQWQKQYRIDNSNKIKQYEIDHSVDKAQYDNQYYVKHSERIKRRGKQYYIDHIEKKKRYYIDNVDKIKEYLTQYRIDNANGIKQYYIDNSDEIKQYCKQYRINNSDKIKQWQKQYRIDHPNKIKQRMKTDIQFRLSCYLRSRLSTALKGNYKAGSAVRDCGCSMAELKVYLESQFTEGMTWQNHSREGWHIDHVIPLSKFNLQDRQQLLIACSYTNLQPLWAKDNLSKNDLHVLDYRQGMF